MSVETFEEKAGKALDSLFPGALFLTGGNESEAQRLIVDTVLEAMRDPSLPPGDATRWFESRLAARYLGEADRPPADVEFEDGSGFLESVHSVDLLRGSSAVPAGARSAIWLVLLKQWSYEDACEALGVSLGSLRSMLRYRSVLAREVVRPEDTNLEDGVAAS